MVGVLSWFDFDLASYWTTDGNYPIKNEKEQSKHPYHTSPSTTTPASVSDHRADIRETDVPVRLMKLSRGQKT